MQVNSKKCVKHSMIIKGVTPALLNSAMSQVIIYKRVAVNHVSIVHKRLVHFLPLLPFVFIAICIVPQAFFWLYNCLQEYAKLSALLLHSKSCLVITHLLHCTLQKCEQHSFRTAGYGHGWVNSIPVHELF